MQNTLRKTWSARVSALAGFLRSPCVGAACSLLLLLSACAHQDAITVTVEVHYPEQVGLITQPRRIISVPRGASVLEATRRLVGNPWRTGLHANRVEVWTRMLLSSTDNDPHTEGHWCWSIGGVYPQTSPDDWTLKPGDTVLWTWTRH